MKLKNNLKPIVFDQFWKSPEASIANFNLAYTTDDQLKIFRLGSIDAFKYQYDGNLVKDPETITRIEALVIPPAWQEVKISILEKGHLQAVGRDVKKRKQYRYHPQWSKLRNQTKFFRLKNFGEKLPDIRKQVEKDLIRKKWDRKKVLALVIKLMDETHIRVGNEQYAKRNKTYGLVTLRKKHVDIYKDKIKFHFVGKRGKSHKITVRNKKLISLVNKCEEIPGWELFHYFDENGEKQCIDSGMVNSYLQEISLADFTAKDFRTWAASLVFFETLLGIGITTDEKKQKASIAAGYKAASKALGNTPNVCKKYYVHPHITASFINGSIQPYFEAAINKKSNNSFFTLAEENLLELIEKYTPNISS